MGVFWSIAGLMSTIAFLTLVFGFFLADTHQGRMEVGVFAIGLAVIPYVFVLIARELNKP